MLSILVLVILIVYGIVSYTLASRREVANFVVSTIGACMRQNLPLVTALQAAVLDRTRRSRTLLEIAQFLATGMPLSLALQQGYRKCPAYIIAAVAAAEQANQVPQAIETIQTEMFHRTRERGHFRPVQPLYVVLVLSVALFQATAISVFVMPKLKEVFWGMGSQMPRATLLAMNASRWGATLLPLLLLLGLIGLPIYIYTRYRTRDPRGPLLFSRIGDFFKWHLPLLRWFEWNYSLSRTADTLRLSLAGGSTVDQAIESATGLDVNLRFRGRLEHWLADVRQGSEPSASARKNGLGATLAWAFDQTVHGGESTLAILQGLADSCRVNYCYRRKLVQIVTWPVLVLLMAACVGSVVYAMFVPLAALIDVTGRNLIP